MKAKQIDKDVYVLSNDFGHNGILFSKEDSSWWYVTSEKEEKFDSIKSFQDSLNESLIFENNNIKSSEPIDNHNKISGFQIKHDEGSIKILETVENPYYEYEGEIFFAGYWVKKQGNEYKVVFCPTKDVLSEGFFEGPYKQEMQCSERCKVLNKK